MPRFFVRWNILLGQGLRLIGDFSSDSDCWEQSLQIDNFANRYIR